MPEDRLFHPRLRTSVRVSSLSYLERCVWEDMLLGADDFGVLPDRPARIRAANEAFLARETDASIATAMETVVRAGLFLRFQHQEQPFLCDPRWQDFQKITRPRRTFLPMPDPDTLALCTPETIVLYARYHPAAPSFPRPEYFARARHMLAKRARKISSHADSRIGGGHRLTANGKRLTANGQRQETPAAPVPAARDALDFDAFYRAYPRHVGRDAAARAWQAALRRATPAEIMAGLERQLPELRSREPRYIPHPATWLNAGRWQDEPAVSVLTPRTARNAEAVRAFVEGHQA